MDTGRKPYQGLINIISFNRHFYMAALLIVLLLLCGIVFLPSLRLWLWLALAIVVLPLFLSLFVSHFIYDRSGFYQLAWLNAFQLNSPWQIANVTAGFDETSWLIQKKFPQATLRVFDFYNAERHTETSIERARKKGWVHPLTEQIDTGHLPVEAGSIDLVIAIFSLHEIRDHSERVGFLAELADSLRPGGKIIVVEHGRDLANFLAYNIGFFHFHSKKEWEDSFREAMLSIRKRSRFTPFINIYSLEKNGTPY